MTQQRVLLIVSGGIAAYKALELIRRLRQHAIDVRCILTAGGAHFVTPLSLSALSENAVYTDLFSLTDEAEMGHIQLSRHADLVAVVPASADILAKMAGGHADDLATTVLLATDTPVLAAPAMNVRMWTHPATQANIVTLKDRGIAFVAPDEGPMACGEFGPGRLAHLDAIEQAILAQLQNGSASKQSMVSALSGRSVLVTSGPTHEPIDPVRYVANRSSGKQGHAIAAALAARGAAVTLVSGPTYVAPPENVTVIPVESAAAMLDACQNALPCDIAVFAAAVADWRVETESAHKIKKQAGSSPPTLKLIENPDILQTISHRKSDRPRLVVGFAAETESVVEKAIAKRRRKGCDWILANDVSLGTGTFGGDQNAVHFISDDDHVDSWPASSKRQVADRLADLIVSHFKSVTVGESL